MMYFSEELKFCAWKKCILFILFILPCMCSFRIAASAEPPSANGVLRETLFPAIMQDMASGGWGFSRETACILLLPPQEFFIVPDPLQSGKSRLVRLESYLSRAQDALMEARAKWALSEEGMWEFIGVTRNGREIIWYNNRLYEKLTMRIWAVPNQRTNSSEGGKGFSLALNSIVSRNACFWFDVTEIMRHDCEIVWNLQERTESQRKSLPQPFSAESDFSIADVANMQRSVFLALPPIDYFKMYYFTMDKKSTYSEECGWGFSMLDAFISDNVYSMRSAFIHRNNLLFAQVLSTGDKMHVVAQKFFSFEFYRLKENGGLELLARQENTGPYLGMAHAMENPLFEVHDSRTLEGKFYIKIVGAAYTVKDMDLENIKRLKNIQYNESERLRALARNSGRYFWEFTEADKKYHQVSWDHREAIIELSILNRQEFWVKLPIGTLRHVQRMPDV